MSFNYQFFDKFLKWCTVWSVSDVYLKTHCNTSFTFVLTETCCSKFWLHCPAVNHWLTTLYLCFAWGKVFLKSVSIPAVRENNSQHFFTFWRSCEPFLSRRALLSLPKLLLKSDVFFSISVNNLSKSWYPKKSPFANRNPIVSLAFIFLLWKVPTEMHRNAPWCTVMHRELPSSRTSL